MNGYRTCWRTHRAQPRKKRRERRRKVRGQSTRRAGSVINKQKTTRKGRQKRAATQSANPSVGYVDLYLRKPAFAFPTMFATPRKHWRGPERRSSIRACITLLRNRYSTKSRVADTEHRRINSERRPWAGQQISVLKAACVNWFVAGCARAQVCLVCHLQQHVCAHGFYRGFSKLRCGIRQSQDTLCAAIG